MNEEKQGSLLNRKVTPKIGCMVLLGILAFAFVEICFLRSCKTESTSSDSSVATATATPLPTPDEKKLWESRAKDFSEWAKKDPIFPKSYKFTVEMNGAYQFVTIDMSEEDFERIERREQLAGVDASTEIQIITKCAVLSQIHFLQKRKLPTDAKGICAYAEIAKKGVTGKDVVIELGKGEYDPFSDTVKFKAGKIFEK